MIYQFLLTSPCSDDTKTTTNPLSRVWSCKHIWDCHQGKRVFFTDLLPVNMYKHHTMCSRAICDTDFWPDSHFLFEMGSNSRYVSCNTLELPSTTGSMFKYNVVLLLSLPEDIYFTYWTLWFPCKDRAVMGWTILSLNVISKGYIFWNIPFQILIYDHWHLYHYSIPWEFLIPWLHLVTITAPEYCHCLRISTLHTEPFGSHVRLEL